MSLDLAKIRSRLDSLKTTTTKSTSLWKPTPGKCVIRIVPYAHNPENPFIELLFHYNMILLNNYRHPSTNDTRHPLLPHKKHISGTRYYLAL